MPYSDGEYSSSTPGLPDPHAEITIDVERMDDDGADEDDAGIEADEEEDCSSNDSRCHRSSREPTAGVSRNKSVGGNGKANRNPTCALCKNHRVTSPLRGHKRYCRFAHCGCDLCRVTRRKQRINADQVSKRRAIQQDRELGLIPPPSSSSGSSSHSGSSTPRTVDSSPLPDKRPPVRPSVIASSSFLAPPPPPPPPAPVTMALPPPPVSMPPAQPQSSHPSAVQLSGPTLIGENLSLESFLLCRNAYLLSNSLRLSGNRLSGEQLARLEQDVGSAARVIRGEVVGHLNDICAHLYDRLQRAEREQPPPHHHHYKAPPFSQQQPFMPINPFVGSNKMMMAGPSPVEHASHYPHFFGQHHYSAPCDASSSASAIPTSSLLYAPFGTQ